MILYRRWLCVCLVLIVLLLSGCVGSETEKVSVEEVDDTIIRDETVEGEGLETTIEEVEIDASLGRGDQAGEPVEVAEVHKIERLMATMSLEEKVGQMFYVDLQTYETMNIPAGGIILFKHDMTTWEGTKEMIAQYQEHLVVPLFVGVDEEGGIVTRITGNESIGGTVVDNAWNLAHSGRDKAVFQASNTIAKELSDLGFNMNFAPVADINSNSANPIIGKRAFSDTPEATAAYVLEALEGYENSGVIPVIKHFPGHGNTKGDSHTESVYVEGDLLHLMENELVPFRHAIEQGVEVVMMGHISLPGIVQTTYPSSLSSEVIGEILIEQLGFEGLIISDSLAMGSIVNHYTTEEVINLGLEAGLDMFLMMNEPEEAFVYLVELATSSEEVRERVDASVLKILQLKHSLSNTSAE